MPPEDRAMPAPPWGPFDRQWISGRWREGRGSALLHDLDPYRGTSLVQIQGAGAADVDEAYASAREAQPAWSAALPAVRAGVLRRAAQLLEAHAAEITGWLVRESGSTRIKAKLEWQAVHAVALEAASMPYRVEGRILLGDVPGKECRVYRRPVGVVALISPWNWPLQLTARTLFPALAVGNAVVIKPSSQTPVTGGLLFARLLAEAGLPDGVLSVLVGASDEIGDRVVTHDVPRVVSFTGSTVVGRRIGRLAIEAPVIKRVELELGGNSPFVVLDDADLDRAAEAAVFGKLLHQGQICMSINRIIVVEAVFEAFLDRFVDRVRALKVGDPDADDTLVGPLIDQRQLDGLVKRIADARASGLSPLVEGDPRGLVLPPHVFARVPNDHPLARDELFGPVAPVVAARDEAEALRLANDTGYGLSSAVFTANPERGVVFARAVDAGMTHVNDQPVNDLPNNPFGGEKNSGIGRFGGDWAIAAFTTDHWVTLQHAPRSYPADAKAIDGPWAGG